MNQFFRVVIRIAIEDDKGRMKYHNEQYIVSALNPTDVEAKMVERLKGSDFEIIAISITKIVEIIN